MTSTHSGIFIFPKSVLMQKGILSKNSKGGKRALRVYPSWDVAENKQAKKTQEWQLVYFFEINQKSAIDREHIKKLFS